MKKEEKLIDGKIIQKKESIINHNKRLIDPELLIIGRIHGNGIYNVIDKILPVYYLILFWFFTISLAAIGFV